MIILTFTMQDLTSESFDAAAYAASLLARHRGTGSNSLLGDDESADSISAGAGSAVLTACEAELAALGRASEQVDVSVRRLLIDEGGQALLAKRSGDSQGTSAIAALQQRVGTACDAAAGVRAAASWLRRDVSDPLAQLKNVAAVLRGVTAAAHVARELQSFLAIVRRLRLVVASGSAEGLSPRDAARSLSADALARAAPLVRSAAAQLRTSPQLAALDMVQAEREWLEATASGMHACAVDDLARAVASMSPPSIASASNVLVTLGDMPLQAAAVLHSLSIAAAAPLREALDVRCIATAAAAAAASGTGAGTSLSSPTAASVGPVALARDGAGSAAPSRSGGATSLSTTLVPPAGSAPAWRGILWGRIESACGERLAAVVSQAWNLVYVLSRCAAAPPRDRGSGSGEGLPVPFPFASLAEQLAAAVLASRLEKRGVEAAHGDGDGDAADGADGVVDHDDAGAGPADDAASSGGRDTMLRLPAKLLQRALWQPLASSVRREVDALVGSDMNVFVRNALTDAAATSGGTGVAAAGGYPRLHYALLAGHAAARWSAAARSGEHAGAAGAAGAGSGSLGGAGATPAFYGSGSAALGSSFDSLSPGSSSSAAAAFPRESLSGVGLFDAAFPAERLLWAVAPLLRLFLARSLARLTDSLHAMFATAAAASSSAGAARRPLAAAAAIAAPSAGSSAASSAAAVAALFGAEAAALASTGASGALSPGQRAVLACFTPSHQFTQLMGSAGSGSSADADPASAAMAGVPTAAAAATFVRALHSELQLCRPPSSLSVAVPGGSSVAALSTAGALTVEADHSLYAAVSRCVWTASRLLAARADSVAAPPPAATALSPTFTPTPAQRANAALACRLMEVRSGLLRAASPGGLLPASVLSVCSEAAAALGWPSLEEAHSGAASTGAAAGTAATGYSSTRTPRTASTAAESAAPPSSVAEARARRALRHPLLAAASEGDAGAAVSAGSAIVQLPPHLLAVETAVLYGRAAAARADASPSGIAALDHRSALLASLAPALASSAPGMLVAAAGALEKACEALIAPWMKALAAPLEAAVLRIHEAAYGAASSASASAFAASTAAPAPAPAPSAAPAPAPSAALASEYALSLERTCEGMSRAQLGLLGPAGGASPLADACRALLAARVLTLWTRHAVMQRGIAPAGTAGAADAAPMSAEQAAGRARLLRDAAVVESAAALLLGRDGDREGERGVPRCIGRAHAELRGLKPLLHVGLHEVIEAAASVAGGSAAAASAAGSAGGAAGAPLPRAAKVQALVRALGPSLVLHSCVARLPADCMPPWAQAAAGASASAADRGPFATARVYSASMDARVLTAAAELEPGLKHSDASDSPAAADGVSDGKDSAATGSGLGASASAVMVTLGPAALAAALDGYAWAQLRTCVEALQSRGSSTASSLAHAAAALLGSS